MIGKRLGKKPVTVISTGNSRIPMILNGIDGDGNSVKIGHPYPLQVGDYLTLTRNNGDTEHIKIVGGGQDC